MRRLTATIFGEVQGVSYRAFVEREAKALSLTGYVRNMPDGSVEVVAEGRAYVLEALLATLKEKHPFARVDRIEQVWGPAMQSFNNFSIQ